MHTGIQYNCTSFVYVGEICRFLVNQPPSGLDRQHKIRFAFGNGMRRNVWEDFNKRFSIKCVEFYGASEGNCSMVNYVSKLGRYWLFLKFSEKCPTSIYYFLVYLFLKSYYKFMNTHPNLKKVNRLPFNSFTLQRVNAFHMLFQVKDFMQNIFTFVIKKKKVAGSFPWLTIFSRYFPFVWLKLTMRWGL